VCYAVVETALFNSMADMAVCESEMDHKKQEYSAHRDRLARAVLLLKLRQSKAIVDLISIFNLRQVSFE
jgi:hypothetical protein